MINKIVWPITIVKARYDGIYEGGKFLAFNLYYYEIPDEIYANDVTCVQWFANESKKYLIGRGSTPQEAYDDLLKNGNWLTHIQSVYDIQKDTLVKCDIFVKCEKNHDIIFYERKNNRCPLCMLMEGIKIVQARIKNIKYNGMERKFDEHL